MLDTKQHVIWCLLIKSIKNKSKYKFTKFKLHNLVVTFKRTIPNKDFALPCLNQAKQQDIFVR